MAGLPTALNEGEAFFLSSPPPHPYNPNIKPDVGLIPIIHEITCQHPTSL